MTTPDDSPSDAAITTLNERIAARTATIAVIGLGYVGLPTAVAYAEAGFTVVGVDSDAGRAESVGRGDSHVEDVSAGSVSAAVQSGRLRAVTDVAEAGRFDVADICVHTPLDVRHEPDLTAITLAAEALVPSLHAGQLVILTSTSYPGTTAEVVAPILARSGLDVGRELLLAFAPERIDPGNRDYTFRNTPKVVGGVTPASTDTAAALLGAIVDSVVRVGDATAAEMVKILENTFRMVNIGFANEMAMICRRLGIDVWEVIDAASTKPFGFMPFRPGPGLGGHCIPVDPSYLAWKMRNLNFKTRFIDLGNDINRGMPDYVVGRCADVLNELSLSVRRARILLIGVAYKPDVGDIRESPALEIAQRLIDLGADVVYADSHVARAVTDAGTALGSIELTAAEVERADLVVVATDHAGTDWAMVGASAKLILDTRGVTALRAATGWRTL